MMQENLQSFDEEAIELESLPAFTAMEAGSLASSELPVANGYPAKVYNDLAALHNERQTFADMRSSGFSLLLHLLDSANGVELLKNLIVEVDQEQQKYHSQELPETSPVNLDIPAAIDALETVLYVGESRQIHVKKQRLKRRLAEWSPPAYLIVNALGRTLDATQDHIDKTLAGKLRKSIRQYQIHRNKMAQANLRLVYSVAQRFRHLGLPFEDLVQEGHLGLIKAIERFDVSKGFRFSTYAHIVISQSIHLALDKQLGLVRLPFKALREKASVEKVRQKLEQTLGRTPHIHELEAHLPDNLEYKSTHISKIIEPNANSQQLYAVSDDAELQAEFTPQEQDSLTNALKHTDLIEQMLTRLSERESYILRMRFGIGLGKEFTLEEISQATGLSRERVRQLANQSVEKLGRIYAKQA